MRKIFMMLITGALVFSMSGCGDKEISIPYDELTAVDVLTFGVEKYDFLAISDMSALNISDTNVTLDSNVYYDKDQPRPYETGVMLCKQKDESDIKIIGTDLINHGKNPFDLWYDLRGVCNIILEPDTTYYYRFFACIEKNGNEEYNSKHDTIVVTKQVAFTTLKEGE